MTYGWAILIVIIVAAALYALGVFNPATWTGTRATGFANIGVPQDWQYSGSTGNLSVIIRNGLGSAITISNVNASCNTTAGAFGIVFASDSPGSLGAGLTRTYYTSSGGCDTLAAGSSYSVQIKVDYTPQGQTFAKSDTGTITGTAV